MKHHKHPHQPGSNGKQKPEPKKIEHRAYELYLDGEATQATTLMIGCKQSAS